MLLANFIPMSYTNKNTTTDVINITKKGTTKTHSIFLIVSDICFPISPDPYFVFYTHGFYLLFFCAGRVMNLASSDII